MLSLASAISSRNAIYPESEKSSKIPAMESAPMPTMCSHTKEIKDVRPSGNGCKECLEMGDEWVHLRLCLTCGHVGCCDSSKNKHATKHFHKTHHPIIKSFQPGEDWRWCYIDEVF